ncbi:acyl-[acyl-carrier-protein]-phospholipid O-acyltransferase / long-chain-fatty-acid--[acyl-carrier-protein] ligase [Arboricoccus pini]|uniref:Acyl-[acyl-carrier-protein]-phospholipid O-acyltransferase / long-chain-fatty-acid--[acyl-carrier-protein] ligase n=1 Tax=Arboricoccus pini TaxID=1963835 RepID=A0A212QYH8_9PROT|nr:MFS transporter [Arboricoccus pini]SNB64769.1 acyl-[acyl-carrier-protein]-phospholipid O-acyltransferase / long-chain-fatty-acid--[acyl-carrier-protein] ligase [Arboricoccus pini]
MTPEPEPQGSPFRLLTKRRFWPLFGAMFLGGLNDNLFRAAIVLYVVQSVSPNQGATIGLIAGALLVIPYFLFSSTAGVITDKFEKARVLRWTKAAEVGIACLGAIACFSGSITFMMIVMFFLGTQMAFFAPAKYAWLPERLREDELVAGNTLVEAGTFLATLIGTAVGGLAVAGGGLMLAAGLAVICAALGFLCTFGLEEGRAADPDLKLSPNPIPGTIDLFHHARSRKSTWRAILMLSWFWAAGGICLSNLPAWVKDDLHGSEAATTFLLTLFAAGVGLGSFMANRIVKGRVSLWPVPAATIGFALTTILLYGSLIFLAADTRQMGVADFLQHPSLLALCIGFLLVAIMGGLLAVPLYAFIQHSAGADERARIIAANNVVTAAIMTAAALACAGMTGLGLPVRELFLVLAVANTIYAIIVVRLLPAEALQGALRSIFKTWLRVEIRGMEHIEAAGPRVVIAPNHVSLADGVLLAAYLEGRPAIAIDVQQAALWYIRPFAKLANLYPIDHARPLAAKALVQRIASGERALIFPEGAISRTGALMKVYPGTAWVVDKAAAVVVPARIEGPERSFLSYLKNGQVRRSLAPKTIITFFPAQRLEIDPELKGRRRRIASSTAMADLMARTQFEHEYRPQTIPAAIVESARRVGWRRLAIEDPLGTRLTYGRLMAGLHAVGAELALETRPGERVGVMLPSLAPTALTILGLMLHGRTPAMINFSAGTKALRAAIDAAQIRLMVTSDAFVTQAKLEPLVDAAREAGVRILTLESLRPRIGAMAKLKAMLRSRRVPAGDPFGEAVILFTSGSEGLPKGVALSHMNLLANAVQVRAVMDLDMRDSALNALPLFHSFGLTGGLILPLTIGIRTILYPSPLHYRVVPEMAYNFEPTFMFGTDTFLNGYARMADAYDFRSVRAIFAGAEPLRETTRHIYAERFGVRILEGYGATETAPVIAINTPKQVKPGTVGRLLPGLSARLEPVEGLEGGRLLLKGPNVMLGYLRAGKGGVIEPTEEGWFDTGDVVIFDENGFLSIKGRVKRFAKIGGEMVSLSAVEELAERVWPGGRHAAVALPDARKGERVVLASEGAAGGRDSLLRAAREMGVPEIMTPAEVVELKALPLLGSGKIDYVALKADLLQQREAA